MNDEKKMIVKMSRNCVRQKWDLDVAKLSS